MGRARYLVDAMVVEGRKPSELARAHGVARSWLYKLLARLRQGGYAALEPRSRWPHCCPRQSSAEVEREVVRPARRTVGARDLRLDVRGPGPLRRLVRRLQSPPAAQLAGLPGACGVRRLARQPGTLTQGGPVNGDRSAPPRLVALLAPHSGYS